MTQDQDRKVVSLEKWTAARVELLHKEKEFVQLRDQLSQHVRSLPWVKVGKDYVFEGPDGRLRLDDLFGTKSQLIVYHFMFDEGWDEGCPSCSLVTDSLEPTIPHLGGRDVALALVSRAPLAKLLSFKQRMGWNLNWVSSEGSDFNQDFQVCTDEVNPSGEYLYNYTMMSRYPLGELPGLSVFSRDAAGQIFHTYSTYARGLETFIGTYSLLDLVPNGRDEEALPFGMAWVRHRDRYEQDNATRADGCCAGSA